MNRRDFLKRGIQVAGGAVIYSSIGDLKSDASQPDSARIVHSIDVTGASSPGGAIQNRKPLRTAPLLRLPVGSIQPRKGWLLKQIDLQRDGLNGRMPEISDYLKYEGNGWVTPGSEVGWEEVGYWLRGFIDLGYVTQDERIISFAEQWVNGILAAQQPDGWFGPANLRTKLDGGPDMWPHMLVLTVLQSYYERSSDPRVIDFMTRYARYQSAVPGPQFGKDWAGARWGDNLDSIYWLYNRTGDSWLLDLATKIHTNMAPWSKGIASWHNVNIAQGFREGAQYWMQSHQAADRDSAYHNYDTVMKSYGQFSGGGFAGDENCRDGYADPRQGFETCGIVEFMRSFEMLARITGDPVWADRCEDLAFNSLPATLDPLQKGLHYITCPNSISLDNDEKGDDFNNDFAMLAYMPGIHNYRCCPHNYGMGWPYYVDEMWLGTADAGLCASLYGASTVRTLVGAKATPVRIEEETRYPFAETVGFTVHPDHPTRFPLYLRIPGWCRNASVRVNGARPTVSEGAGPFFVLDRTWRAGDTVELHLPMNPTIRRWHANHDSISIQRGPLTYSLAIKENWERIGGTDRWPEYQVQPGSSWNYGIVEDGEGRPAGLRVTSNPAGSLDDPWKPEAAPLKIEVQAKKIPAWQPDAENVVGLLQPSPAISDEPVETVTLIPMGAARLRITSFPTIGEGPYAHEWIAPGKTDEPASSA